MAKRTVKDLPKVDLSDEDKATIIQCILNSIHILVKHGHILTLISEWREMTLNDIQQLSIIKFMGNQPYVHDEVVVSAVAKFIIVKNAITSALISEMYNINSGKLSAEEFVKSYTKLIKLLELYHNHITHSNHE